jgi:hypothetical protein
MKQRFPLALMLVLLGGCTSMNDALTPSTQLLKDDFDGTVIVRQEPVTAADGMREPWHSLGFEWSQKAPDTIYITVGAHGIGNISEVAFNADGRAIGNIKPVSALTNYGKSSTRRFAMPWAAFLALADAKSVKMKVLRTKEYTVSSFGPSHAGAAVNPKIAPFVATVRDLRGGTKKASQKTRAEQKKR